MTEVRNRVNVPPVDTNFQFRTIRSRNIPYDTRNRTNDRQQRTEI